MFETENFEILELTTLKFSLTDTHFELPFEHAADGIPMGEFRGHDGRWRHTEGRLPGFHCGPRRKRGARLFALGG